VINDKFVARQLPGLVFCATGFTLKLIDIRLKSVRNAISEAIMNKSFLFLICFAVLFLVQANGEDLGVDKCDTNLIVRGYVLEKDSGEPIENANIFTSGCGRETNCLTDVNGFFKIPVCSIGRHRLYITAEGYASCKISVRVEKEKEAAEQKIEMSPSSKVTGFVKNQAGKGVAGARIKTNPFAQDKVRTDANGFYEIDGINPEENQYTLYVTCENYPEESVRFTPAQAGMTAKCDVLLESGVTIYGTVTGPDGKAVSNAAVGPADFFKKIQTDANGLYKLENIKKGELVLSAYHPEYSPYVQTFQIGRQESERKIDIELENSKPLRGRVVDKQGNGIEGVNIKIREFNGVYNIYPRNSEYTTDSQGDFVIENGPSTGKLEISVYSDRIASKTTEINCDENEHVIEVNMGGEVYGRVVDDATGEAVRQFNVKLESSHVIRGGAGGYSSTWSREGYNFDDPNGLFDTGDERLPIGGAYAVTVCAEGYDLLTIDPVESQSRSSEPNRNVFRLKPAVVITGRVVDSQGDAIEGATVRWFSEENRLNQNDEDHWSDVDTSVTDVNGVFSFDRMGTGKRGLYVAAKGYAPYINAKLMIPDDAGELSHIVLEKGANISGTVFEEGSPQAGVEISCDLHGHYDLNQMGYIDKRAYTDTQGRYSFSDLPSGEMRIYKMSPVVNMTSHTLASKKITLKPGENVLLDFGNEGGCTITGQVTMGKSFLSNARVSFRKDDSSRTVFSDSNGTFKITGLEKGQYEVCTEHSEPPESESEGTTFYTADRIVDTRQIQVDSDMDVTIDFGAFSLSGTIPAEFMDSQSKYLFVGARKWELKEQAYLRNMTYKTNWQTVGSSRLDADGNFKIINLRPGKYYLALYEGNGPKALSKIIELGDSEKVDNINLTVPQAKLRVAVVDAQDKKPVAGAFGVLYNKDLEIQFFGKLKGHPQVNSVFTDANGLIEYEDLPQGNYILSSGKKGYLTNNTDFKIDDGQSAEMQIALEKSAVVQFELAKDANGSITRPMVYMYFKVTDVKSGELFTVPTHIGLMKEMFVYFKMPQNNPAISKPDPYINLPTGKYLIDYEVFQDEMGHYDGEYPVVEGQTEADVTAGQTARIVIGEN
jgi:hypothetical protein